MKKYMVGIKCNEIINIRGEDAKGFMEVAPEKLFHLPKGTIRDKDSFAILSKTAHDNNILCQFSLETIKLALNDVGFDIIKL